MNEGLVGLLAEELVEIRARRVKPRTLENDIADSESAVDEMIQSNASGCQVAPVLSRFDVEVVVSGKSLEGFDFDEGDLSNVGNLGVMAETCRIPVAVDSNSNGKVGFFEFEHRFASTLGNVNVKQLPDAGHRLCVDVAALGLDAGPCIVKCCFIM